MLYFNIPTVFGCCHESSQASSAYVYWKTPSVSFLHENFAYHAEVTKTKPWTTRINSPLKITDLSKASFPEICNILHMGGKCGPDGKDSCCLCCLHPKICAVSSKLCSVVYSSQHGNFFMCKHLSFAFSNIHTGKLWIILPQTCWLTHCQSIYHILFEKMKELLKYPLDSRFFYVWSIEFTAHEIRVHEAPWSVAKIFSLQWIRWTAVVTAAKCKRGNDQ